MAASALAGLWVIDISSSVAGAWCSRMLADFGADVVLVEPPEGHPIRDSAPFDTDGTSIAALWLLANKRSVTLDWRSPPSAGKRMALLRTADIVISSSTPAGLATAGTTYADIANAGLIMAHITPHGMTGDLAEVLGNDLTAAARSGWASINGEAQREPLKLSGWQSSLCAGTAAYAGILAALHHRETHPGEGQEVDVSEVDVMVSTYAPAMLREQYSGKPIGRRKDADLTAGPVPVADGYFSLTISRAHFWRDAMNVLGLPDLAEDERWAASYYRAAHKEEYVSRVEEKMRSWKKMDLFDELALRRVIAGPVLLMDELANNDHLRDRGFWVHPEEGGAAVEYPGAAFRMSATPWRLRHLARTPGADTAAVLEGAPTNQEAGR